MKRMCEKNGFEYLIVLKLNNVIHNCQGFKSLLGVGEQAPRKTRKDIVSRMLSARSGRQLEILQLTVGYLNIVNSAGYWQFFNTSKIFMLYYIYMQ